LTSERFVSLNQGVVVGVRCRSGTLASSLSCGAWLRLCPTDPVSICRWRCNFPSTGSFSELQWGSVKAATHNGKSGSTHRGACRGRLAVTEPNKVHLIAWGFSRNCVSRAAGMEFALTLAGARAPAFEKPNRFAEIFREAKEFGGNGARWCFGPSQRDGAELEEPRGRSRLELTREFADRCQQGTCLRRRRSFAVRNRQERCCGKSCQDVAFGSRAG
jgi:hypothetical protein